jgi:ribosomal subunit interface protein
MVGRRGLTSNARSPGPASLAPAFPSGSRAPAAAAFAERPLPWAHFDRRRRFLEEENLKTDVAILHHEYPARVRDRVATKLQHLARFYDGTLSLRAVLERQHDVHRVELVANVRRGVVLVVDARGASITAALEDAIERMKRVLARHKDRLRGNGRRKGRTTSDES